MPRAEFSSATRILVASRAGFQCSFPTCNRRTSGPGTGKYEVSNTGVGAHIYSASPGGSRGQGGLSPQELKQPENCIWLCHEHAKVVDNNRGIAFPPETLLSYKSLQEARVAREVQGLYSPLGWLHEITINENPLFAFPQTIRFAKLNLVFGLNNSGKTALTQWIAGSFDESYLQRWQTENSRPICFSLSYLNPVPQIIQITLKGHEAFRFCIGGQSIPFSPIHLRFIRLGYLRHKQEEDDLSWLSRELAVSPQVVRNLVDEIHAFPHAHVRNLRFGPDKYEGGITLCADVEGTVPGLPLHALSYTETEMVFIEFATAIARISGRYVPTILVLDGCPVMPFLGMFDFYSHHFLDAANQFQTIMCIHSANF